MTSELPLPELRTKRALAAPPGAWHVRLGGTYPGPDAQWFHQWREPDGRLWLRIGHSAKGVYVLRFTQWAAFVIDVPRLEISCYPSPETPTATIRHLLLNQVLPLVAARTDHLVLHASAVVHERGAIGFVGPSGTGKSTLCAALGSEECRLLTDDALVLQRAGCAFYALPTYAGVRLWPDVVNALSTRATVSLGPVSHYSDKVRVDVMPLATNRAPLFRLCVLVPGNASTQLNVHPLRPREAAIALTKYHFQLDVTSPSELSDSFSMMMDIVERVPVLQVTYPRRLNELAAMAPVLLDTIVAS